MFHIKDKERFDCTTEPSVQPARWLRDVIANGVVLVALCRTSHKIAIYVTTSRRSLMYKRIQPDKSGINCGVIVPLRLSVRELGRLEKKKTKCEKCLGRFPCTVACSRGRTVSTAWCIVWTFSSWVPIRRFVSLSQCCLSIVLWYTNNHYHPYIDNTTVITNMKPYKSVFWKQNKGAFGAPIKL